MLVVDANVLLYAVNEDAPGDRAARRWLDDALDSVQPVAFTWTVLLAFVRLATNAALFPQPLDVEQAVAVVRGWLQRPAALVVHPTPRHLDVLAALLSPLGSAANIVNDAHLAALATEHGATVVSFDRDFARFAGVRWRQPPPVVD
ncbi:MAG: type II toxin-antitoxin system VapC family toxin [Actinomycetota bacterium]|nr:type II toxin-antitoxin system VapC family toxin [Actinomycetota bacterium]